MTSATLTAAELVAAPVAATAVGSILATRRPPSASATSALQHLAAGIVIAAVAGEILPDLRDRHSLPATLAGFITGIGGLLALSTFERRCELSPAPTNTIPRAMLIAITIDLLIDGVLLGTGAALGEGQGLTLAVALTFEVLFLGLSLTSELLERGTPARLAAAIPIAASTAIILGAIGGAALLSHANNAVLAGFLAFGSAALLYLVTEELLTEAHDTPDTNVHIILFFVGFVAPYTHEGIV